MPPKKAPNCPPEKHNKAKNMLRVYEHRAASKFISKP
jgi:hypothetical protein